MTVVLKSFFLLLVNKNDKYEFCKNPIHVVLSFLSVLLFRA